MSEQSSEKLMTCRSVESIFRADVGYGGVVKDLEYEASEDRDGGIGCLTDGHAVEVDGTLLATDPYACDEMRHDGMNHPSLWFCVVPVLPPI